MISFYNKFFSFKIKSFRKLALIFLSFFISIYSLNAAMSLSEQSLELQKLTASLNEVQTFSATFEQYTSNNTMKKGKFYLKKPGKMRFEYDGEAEFTLLSDGKWLIYHDLEMDEAHYFDIKKNPLAILLFNNIDLANMKNVQIKSFEKVNNQFKIEIFYSEEQSNIILFFNQDYMLQGWITHDPQGKIVKIVLHNISINNPLENESKLFVFRDPRRQYGKIKKF